MTMFKKDDYQKIEMDKTVRWDEKGKTVEGRVVSFKDTVTKNGPVTICNLRDEQSDEINQIWLNPVQITEFFSRENVKDGDYIGIKYTGKNGRMKSFEFAIERQEG